MLNEELHVIPSPVNGMGSGVNPTVDNDDEIPVIFVGHCLISIGSWYPLQ